jgi:hypothetical protein
MNRLIGRILVSLRGLTSTEIRQYGSRQVQLQQALDTKLSVLHHQRAAERIRVLDTVASEMKHVGRSVLQEQTQA